MSSRPRSLRADRLPRKRTLRPRLEDLEIRLVLSTRPFSATTNYYVVPPASGASASGQMGGGDGINGPAASSLTPAQMRAYYGVNGISFGGVTGDGAGQTIAIVDVGDQPGFVDTGASNFAGSDLAVFDQYFNLPDPPSFTKLSQTGTTTLPGPVAGWTGEEALDIEWAHAIAPGASIVLVEAASQAPSDLVAAEEEAASLPGVSVVTNSWSFPMSPYYEQAFAPAFQTPNGHQGVTFLASTGDSGSTGQDGDDPFAGPPADLAGVVAVGGTSLIVQDGTPTEETAWNTGGGGISRFIGEPSYQDAVQSTGFRTTPDVSMDAALVFGGVALYDPGDFGGWVQIGGTSLSSPMWAGLIAIADQGRVAAGGTTLDGATQTLPALYSLPSYDFNDIVAGDNEGAPAVTGYDTSTGLGSPRANLLVPDLAAYGLVEQSAALGRLRFTTQPPSSVYAGSSFGLSVAVTDPFGDVDTNYSGPVTLSLSTNPGSGSFTPVTVDAVKGVAVFDGLSLGTAVNGYEFSASAAGLTTVVSNAIDAVIPPPGSGAETLYPAPSFASLTAALNQAATDSATNITIRLEAGIYALSRQGAAGAPLVIQDSATNVPLKTITIVGAGEGSTIIEPSQLEGWGSSIFEIIGQAGAEVTVTIQGLTIEGGQATTGGVLGGNTAVGGGLLIDGGTVTLDQVALVHDAAVGKPGSVGSAAARKRQGGSGGAGEAAAGGGLYVASGTVNLQSVTFDNDNAWGGHGGTGGVGGTDGGRGGTGGRGGSASGGAAFVAGGVVTGSDDAFSSDAAVGGWGGYGGRGGLGGTQSELGSGGRGGQAGSAFGGGLFISGGTVTLTATPISRDVAYGGRAGTGGLGGYSRSIHFPTSHATTLSFTSYPSFIGFGGSPGTPGRAGGGGVYIGGGSLTLGAAQAPTVNIQSDRAQGGFFGSSGDARLENYVAADASGARRLRESPQPPSPGPIVGPPARPAGGGAGDRPTVAGAHPVGRPHGAGHADASSSSSSGGSVGYADGGGLYIGGGSVHLYSQNISNDLANYGGGIYKSGSGAVVASGLSMDHDAAEIGGAIVNSGTLTITRGVLADDRAAAGVDGYSITGAAFTAVRGSTGGAIMNLGRLGLVHSTISNNNARYGGGIDNQSGQVTGTNLHIDSNRAISRGGGIYSVNGSLTLKGEGLGTIHDNTVSATGSSLSVAVGSGGGIDLKGGGATITGMTVSGNSARAGGGIYVSSATADFTATDFAGNIARQYGGAVYNLGTVDIGAGTLSGNSARIDGGAVDNFSSLTITGATVSSNTAGNDGGAINNPDTVKLTGDTITLNAAGNFGGGVDNGGVLVAKTTTLSSNVAYDGGGLFDVGSATLTNGDAVDLNVAVASGGGIDEGSGGQVKATGLHVVGNIAQQGNGGGIYDKRGSLSIVGGEVSSNNAPANLFGDALGWGGGVFDSGGKVSLSTTPVESNSAIDGGGLYISTGSVSLQGGQLGHNTAAQSGGGVWNLGTLTLTSTTVTLNVASQQNGGGIENTGKVTISNSALSQNTATAGTGGDLDNGPTGTFTITQSTLTTGVASSGGDAANAGNLTIGTSTVSFGTATSRGGGLSNAGSGTVRLANSTIAENSSTGHGGGIDTSGNLTVVNVTIAYNQAGSSGAGLDVEAGTTSVVNTIVDLDTGGTDLAGPISTSSANNLFGTSSIAPAGTDNLVGVTDPGLGQLGNNGGATQTIALLPGSPAIDAGSNALGLDPTTGNPLTSDQRGALRGALGLNAGTVVDIGAFEASSSYMVTSTADSLTISGTLRSAINWAEGGFNYNPANIAHPVANTIVFDITGTFAIPQTITLTSALPQLTGQVDPLHVLGSVPIEIEGPGGGVVNVSGAGQFQVFSVAANTQVILQGITVADGLAAQGGGIGNAGTLTLNNTVVMGNSAGIGGGIFSDGTLTITGGTIEDNSASDGGGIYGTGTGAFSVSGASLQGNSASVGGGIYANTGTLTLSDDTITANSAGQDGGGVFAEAQVGTTVIDGTFSGNSATFGAGIEFLGGTSKITGTTLSGNSAPTGGAGFGGAIALIRSTANGSGTLIASGLSLSNNVATGGGAIFSSGTLTLAASTLTDNSAAISGGGIDNTGTLTVSATTLDANSSATGGGIATAGTLTVIGSTLSGNSAVQGGGIADTDGLADVITDATFAGNSATAGGGIYSDSSALSLINATVAYNAVASGGTGAGLDVAAGSVGLYNTIVDLNTGTGSTDVGGDGSTTGSNNLIATANPGLASGLANNGGPTQTIALLAGSPALNAGSASIPGLPTTDQRGAVRGSAANAGGPAYAGGPPALPGGPAYAGALPDIGAFEASSEYQVTQFDGGATAADSNDLSTLRTAIGWADVSVNANLATPAAEPNTVVFAAGGTITLSPALPTLVVSNTATPVVIENTGPSGVVISGGGAVAVLQVTSNVTASLSNLTITDGSAAAGGGGISNAGTLTLSGVTVSSSTAGGSGGGISNTGSLVLSTTTITGDSARGSGGGISNAGTLTLMPGTTITGNTATVDGGGINDSGTLNLMPTATSAITISDNTAAAGGGVLVAGTLTDVGATYTGNTATTGGGLAILSGGTATLTGATITGNAAGSTDATGSGGGIDNAGTLTVFASTIGSTTNGQTAAGNTSTGKGGGIDNESGGTLTLSYSTVGNNAAASLGGGGLDNSGSATLSVTTIAFNTAATLGGGIDDELGSTLVLSDSTLADNSATTGGGGFGNAGTATVANTTIAGNQGGKGGGVYDLGTLTVSSTTIAYNAVAAGGAGGGLDAVNGSTVLYNTIVAQNTAGVGTASDAAGSLAPISAYDLFGTGGSGGLVALNGIQVNVKNPGLGQLAGDGGPTQTIALLAGSPAIDSGGASIPGNSTPTVDQRGALRGPAGLNAGSSPDIGAYEASSSYLVATDTDSTLIGTLRSAIAWANTSTNANPANLAPHSAAPNTAVFNTTGAFAGAQTIGISSALPTIVITDQTGSGVAIDGSASNGLTISGGGAAQLFSIDAGATVTLSGLTISGGYVGSSGGAISNSGTLTIKDSTLSGNSAAGSGGAIDNLGTLTIMSSTLSGNSAGQYGGAIDDESSGTFMAIDSTFAGNAAARGGGLYSTGTLTAISDTIAYNTTTSPTSGGGLDAAAGTAALYNTIVASNSDSSAGNPADDIAGSVLGGSSNNLIGDGGSGGIIGGSLGNIVLTAAQSPGLAPGLGNNGGPTQTIALAPSSPAIGMGLPNADGQSTVYDQRGTLRKSPTIDIGAFEYSSTYLVTTALDSTVPGTLRSAVAWANSDTGLVSTVPLTIEFDTQNLFATPQAIDLGLGVIALTNTDRPIVIEGPGASIVTINAGGASGVFSVAAGVTAEITGVTITGGMAAAGGGIDNAGALAVSNASFVDNTSPSGSGAAISNTGTLAVSASDFTGNAGSYYGGAIFNDDGSATVSDSSFVDNSTLYGLGGAIENLGGSLTVTGGTFQGNTAFQGGAIYNRNDAANARPGTATISGASIISNTGYQGGGLFNEGTMSASNNLIANNTAFQGGGVSNNFGGTMTIGDSTIAFNTAQQYGGAIDNVSTLTVIGSTVAYNVVASGGSGGGIDAYAGTTALYDSIAALNTIGTGKAGVASDVTGRVMPSSSYNLIGAGGLVNGVNHNIVGTTDPGLATSLANNGGPTETLALIVGSPAIGAGSATIAGVAVPTVDQRGVARPATGFDIGAFQGSIPAPAGPTPIIAAVVPAPASLTASAMVSAASSAAAQGSVTSGLVAVIHGHTPFRGRNLHAKSHRQSKTAHGGAVAHQAARTASPARRTVTVKIVKHNPH